MLRYANLATENFSTPATTALLGLPLDGLLPADSPVFALIEFVRAALALASPNMASASTCRASACAC